MKVVVSLVATVFIFALAFIPTWIFLGVRSFSNPEGFWQNIALFGLGFWVFGGIQMVLAIAGVAVTTLAWLMIWDRYDRRG